MLSLLTLILNGPSADFIAGKFLILPLLPLQSHRRLNHAPFFILGPPLQG